MSNARPTFSQPEFRKAGRSQPTKECVHVARRDGWVGVRDSKKAFGTSGDHHLVFTAGQFDDFLGRVLGGDLPSPRIGSTRQI
ncbi:DUF397 domain-containing protein [Streptoalloteichus hindustanus]|nr:DUF397 domain-containing protein [Streptoalloteichus hindustanus]